MEAALIQIRHTQEAAWNEYAPGWKRWEAWTRMMLGPIGNAIIGALHLRGDEEVLDLATGAGDPGINIAKRLPFGNVTGTDISENMLEAAAITAQDAAITNYATIYADACELPFANDCFDAISCRHGFMFFPDMELAAAEALRVLKPGGRLAVSFWGMPEKNFWAHSVMQAVRRHTNDQRERQHLFRCSEPGKMKHIFHDAGLHSTREQVISGTVSFGSAESYWRHFTKVVMPVAKAISQHSSDTQRAIRLEVFDRLVAFRTVRGHLELPFEAIVLSGTK